VENTSPLFPDDTAPLTTELVDEFEWIWQRIESDKI